MRFTLSKTGFGDRKLGISGWGVSHRLRLFRIFRYRFDLFVFIDGLLDNTLRCGNQRKLNLHSKKRCQNIFIGNLETTFLLQGIDALSVEIIPR